MKAAPITREERAAIRLARYKTRAKAQRLAAKKRKPERRKIAGGHSKSVSISERTGTHAGQHIDRIRVAGETKVRNALRKLLAKVSKRMNR